MSKSDLAHRLNALLSAPKNRQVGEEHETELQIVLHELEVYQIELEMQVEELRESRQALEESHNRYVNLYDFAPVGYVTLTDQGMIREINLTGAGMLGIERRWLIDRSFASWIAGPDLPLFRRHLKGCREIGGKVRSTLHLINRGRQSVPVEISTSCFVDSVTGAPLLRTTITDLTEIRRAEADLDRFFTLSTDLLCIFGDDGKFQRVNPACEKILGYTPGEMLRRSGFDFMHPEDRDDAFATLLRLRAEGASVHSFECRYLKKDRSTVWISWSTITSGGKVYCVGRDITEQVQRRQQAEDQYAWLKEMVRLIPLPLALVDTKTDLVVSTNGLTQEQVRGFPKDKELNHEPAILRTPKGNEHVLVSSRFIREQRGQRAMTIFVTQDVTDLKRAEETLQDTIDVLKRERELRERFVFTLTHDLRSPLTGARISAELLAKHSQDPEVLKKLSSRIIRSVDRIDYMVQSLLDANRIRAGEKLPLNLTEFDLIELVRDTLGDLSEIHGNRFTFQEHCSVRGRWDKLGLRRVVENLVNNAIKYGDPLRPVSISVFEESADSAVLSVQNFGNPISKRDQATLFDQFRRSSEAESGTQKGWGLGLTLVRGIIEAHGGTVTVESNVRKGTTFRALIPKKN